ncbi:uncharacterized protein LOC143072529 isoform X2 [Mytilus galloprovincialis]|uniref:uncharacterized protein LOC143072529 isoform X2 n=1 Tax=Mytilus galloprovincialis TaxID=29158 RepID=UPI003F7B5C96
MVKMPKQRARSKRRAAPSDLTDRDLVIDPVVLPTVETTTSNTPRGRKRVRNIGPTPSTAHVMNIASTTAQPTADEIAAAMITQLKGAGLHLTDSSGVRLSDDRLSSVCGMRSGATQEAVSGTDNQTESQHTLPSSSSNTVHYSLVPPVTSDLSVAGYFTASSPTTQEDQTLESPSHSSLVKSNSSFSATASFESMTRKLLQASLSTATRASYNRMLKAYEQFCKEHFPLSQAYPSTHMMVSHFISFLFLQNYKPSTIASYVSAISYVHKLKCLTDPTNSFLIKKIIKGAQNLRSSCDTRLPITKEILSKLLLAVSNVIRDQFNQFLLKAMMSLAFHCFLRIGEIAVKNKNENNKVLQLSDISVGYKNQVPINMTVTITFYKHSDLRPKTILITRNFGNMFCPVKTMMDYIKVAKHKSGPLFQFLCGTPVSYTYFNSSLKSLLICIGLSPELYKGHSFRIGAATSEAAKGTSLSVIQQMGRWKSNALQNYIRIDNF